MEKKEVPLSIYSEYLKPIHNKNVIGVNLAFMLGDWVSVMYFCDSHIFRGYKAHLDKFHNLKVTCAQSFGAETVKEMINIKRLKRDVKPGLSFRPDTICWNNNSGAAAINFAVLTGAKRIMLLGYDMKSNEGKTHWVNGADGPLYTKPSSEMTFKIFKRRFPAIATQAREHGVEILNVGPDSALEDFRKVSLSEVL